MDETRARGIPALLQKLFLLVRVLDFPTNETGRSVGPERPFWRGSNARSRIDVTALGTHGLAGRKALAEKAGKNQDQAFNRDTLHTHFPNASPAKIRIPAA
jgi:hypothetical protein